MPKIEFGSRRAFSPPRKTPQATQHGEHAPIRPTPRRHLLTSSGYSARPGQSALVPPVAETWQGEPVAAIPIQAAPRGTRHLASRIPRLPRRAPSALTLHSFRRDRIEAPPTPPRPRHASEEYGYGLRAPLSAQVRTPAPSHFRFFRTRLFPPFGRHPSSEVNGGEKRSLAPEGDPQLAEL